jgi:hypothetical protein
VNSRRQSPASAARAAVPKSAMAPARTTTGRPSTASRYQRTPTRQRRLRRARSRTPARPSLAATTSTAARATPKMVPSDPHIGRSNGKMSVRARNHGTAVAQVTA